MLFGNNGTPYTDSVSPESMSYIFEAAMLEELSSDEIEEFVSDPDATAKAVKEGVVTERTIVRLDKQSKLQKAYKTAIFVIAKEKNDRDFKKLLTVWKMERNLEAKLEKKYGNQAMRRAKETMRKGKTVNVPALTKAANNTAKKLEKASKK